MSVPEVLSLPEKQQAVYAALLKHTAEVAPLRERALDRVVSAGLLASSEQVPFTSGDIDRSIQSAGGPCLRPATIHEAVDRLIAQSVVVKTQLRKKNAYYLQSDHASALTHAVSTGNDLFAPVIADLVRDTNHLVDHATAEKIIREFITASFSRFGRELARSIAVRGGDDALTTADAQAVFNSIKRAKTISDAARESLLQRCVGFLRSRAPASEQLKFSLTQGYYVAQLLEFDGLRFNPLAEDAFKGAIFYADTNLVIPHVLGVDEGHSLLVELISVADRVGAKIRITQATIDEARTAAAEHVDAVRTVATKVHADVGKLTRDDFMRAFLERRDADPAFSPDRLLDLFDGLSTSLQSIGIELDERIADEIISSRDTTIEATAIDESAEQGRGFGKSGKHLVHDVAHVLAIGDLRHHGQRAWFLTRDRTLAQAATILAGQEVSTCLSIAAFLQSVSPYLSGAQDEYKLADAFSRLIVDAVPAGASLFDLKELEVIATLHEDVLSTDPAELVRALDYAKSEMLKGKLYEREAHTRVALSLKKYLTSSSNERNRILLARTEQLGREVAAATAAIEVERAARQLTEDRASAERLQADSRSAQQLADAAAAQAASLQTVESQLTAARQSSTEKEARLSDDIATAEKEKATLKAQLDEQTRRNARNGGLFLAAIGAAWMYGFRIVIGAVSPDALTWFWPLNYVHLIGMAGIYRGAWKLLLVVTKAQPIRIAVLTVVGALLIITSRAIDHAAVARWSPYVATAGLIATIALTLGKES